MTSKSSVRLALYSGLTSLVATLLYQAGESFVALPFHDKLKRAETIFIVTAASIFVIEPLLHSILSPMKSARPSGLEGVQVRVLRAGAIGVFASILDGLLHEYLGETISPKGFIGIVQLITSLLGPFAVTFAWLRGVHTTPPRAAKYGFLAGIALGIFVFVLDTAFVIHYTVQIQKVPIPRGMSPFEVAEATAIFALGFLWATLTIYFPGGFLGGLALDRGWCSRAWQRIVIGLGAAAIAQPLSSLVVLTVFAILARSKTPPPLSVGAWVVPALVGNIGWALAFYLDPDADVLLQRERTEMDSTPRVRTEAIKLIEAAGGMFVFATAIGIVCMISCMLVTRDSLKRGSRPMVSPSPSARVTPSGS